MRTCVYIDAYNLYYGSLKGTPYRWLDLGKLCSLLLPKHEIVRIRYCTAHVKTLPGKVGTDQRQQTYLRALGTVPNLSIHLGRYQQHIKSMKRANRAGFEKVVSTEEKGSDVNLASYMLADGFRNECEQTVLISNDSDLTLPVRLLRDELHRHVLVITPTTNGRRRPSVELTKAASATRQLREGPLKGSQFAAVIVDANGREIRKPSVW